MNQEEADQDVVDEVSEEVDSRGMVMRSEIQPRLCSDAISYEIILYLKQ